MDVQDYYTAFDLDMPEVGSAEAEETTENNEEAAEAAEETDSTEDSRETGTEAEGEKEQETAEPDGSEKEQSIEERAQFAAARRKAEKERDAAIQRVQEDARKEIDDIIVNMGLSNPYTNKPITNRQEYDEYRIKHEEEQREKMQKKAGISEAEFKQFVESLPEVRAAKQKAAEAEAITRKANEDRVKQAIDRDVAEISALDSNVKSLEDLSKLENYEEIKSMVHRGYTILDAYRLLNFDRLTERKAAAAKQAAINATNAKGHMTTTNSRGQGAVSVPKEVIAEYRTFNPDATEAEIAKHYTKYMKG